MSNQLGDNLNCDDNATEGAEAERNSEVHFATKRASSRYSDYQKRSVLSSVGKIITIIGLIAAVSLLASGIFAFYGYEYAEGWRHIGAAAAVGCLVLFMRISIRITGRKKSSRK